MTKLSRNLKTFRGFKQSKKSKISCLSARDHLNVERERISAKLPPKKRHNIDKFMATFNVARNGPITTPPSSPEDSSTTGEDMCTKLADEASKSKSQSSKLRLKKADKGLKGKLKDYYYVERILGHRILEVDGEPVIEYLIKWLDYTDDANSYQPQSDLDGSRQLLTQYHKDHKTELKDFPLDKMKWKTGFASKNLKYNDEVWCTVEQVIERLQDQIRIHGYDLGLKIYDFSSDLDIRSDAIVYVCMDFHLYIGLYLADEKRVFIGDGENRILQAESREIIEEGHVRDNGIEVIPIEYSKQNRVDHCGSSACSIGVELARMFKNDRLLAAYHGWRRTGSCEVSVSKRIRERNIAALNKGQSEKLPTKVGGSKFNRCTYCGWASMSTSRRALSNHLRIHN